MFNLLPIRSAVVVVVCSSCAEGFFVDKIKFAIDSFVRSFLHFLFVSLCVFVLGEIFQTNFIPQHETIHLEILVSLDFKTFD